jgi:hypothetical protein
VYDDISAEMGKHRGFEAIAPKQVASDNSNDVIEQDSTHDSHWRHLDQRGGGRKMPQAKGHRRNDGG